MAVVMTQEPEPRGMIDRLLTTGALEATLASLAVVLTVVFTYLKGQPGEVLILDVALFAAAALTARFPRAAGAALGVGLAAMLLIPSSWATLGEYASLIAVLGAGMRRRTRTQLAMIVGYAPLLIVTTARDAPELRGAVMGAVAWSILLGVVWAVGRLFATVTGAHESQRKADLVLQRQQLTRELHDGVARSLVLVVRRSEHLQRIGVPTPDDLAELTEQARTAHQQLRVVMELLGDPTAPVQTGSTSFDEALGNGRVLLHQSGFTPTITVAGDTRMLTDERSQVLGATAGEAFANMVKHGDPSRPCSVSVSVDAEHAEFSTLNHPRADAATALAISPLGLHAMHERLAALDGAVSTGLVGSQWHTRILLPLSDRG